MRASPEPPMVSGSTRSTSAVNGKGAQQHQQRHPVLPTSYMIAFPTMRHRMSPARRSSASSSSAHSCSGSGSRRKSRLGYVRGSLRMRKTVLRWSIIMPSWSIELNGDGVSLCFLFFLFSGGCEGA